MIEADMESRKGAYMAECKRLRGLIKDKLEASNNAGVPRKALKDALKIEKLEAKIRAIVDGDEDDADSDGDRETLEQVAAALGVFAELPLGRAAIEAVEKRDALDELTSDNDDEDDFDRVGRENAAKLKAGIKEAEPVH